MYNLRRMLYASTKGTAMAQRVSSVSPKGQVTIPADIRRMLGVKPRDLVAFSVEDGRVQLVAVRSALDAVFRSVPALDRPRSDGEIEALIAEEHARHVVSEDADG